MRKLKVLDLFSGIGGFLARSGAHWRLRDGRFLRDRGIPPQSVEETLARGALLS
jgi:hypothetical protein